MKNPQFGRGFESFYGLFQIFEQLQIFLLSGNALAHNFGQKKNKTAADNFLVQGRFLFQHPNLPQLLQLSLIFVNRFNLEQTERQKISWFYPVSLLAKNPLQQIRLQAVGNGEHPNDQTGFPILQLGKNNGFGLDLHNFKSKWSKRKERPLGPLFWYFTRGGPK